VLWRQLRNPLLILLAGAAIVSVVVGEGADAAIILVIVWLSVGLGFFNEYRSEKAAEELHSSIRRHTAVTTRGGRVSAVDVTELVVRRGMSFHGGFGGSRSRPLSCSEPTPLRDRLNSRSRGGRR
jgi:magnesium-transporting ATPase (P-type)